MASRFWVGGTGTWDNADTTHWASSSGGAGGQSVPGSGDTVTFDGSSGGGTVTLNFGGTITIQSLTMGAFTGTWDNSVNNNNITVTNNTGNVLNFSGSGTRTIKLGSATYTVSGSSSPAVNIATITNLTWTPGTATFVFSGTGGKSISGPAAALSLPTLSFTGTGTNSIITISGGNLTAAAANISAPNYFVPALGTVLTITAAAAWNGTSSQPIGIATSTAGLAAELRFSASSSMSWVAIRDINSSGGATTPSATNSFDLGGNTGITITAPPSSAGRASMINNSSLVA